MKTPDRFPRWIIATLAIGLAAPMILLACSEQAAPALIKAQREVNSKVRYVPEPAGKDEWKIAVTEGDCEDFALAKRVKLLAAGYKPERLKLIAMRLPRSKEYHAALMVDELWILDNNFPHLRVPGNYRTEGYTFHCVYRDLTLGDLKVNRCDPTADRPKAWG